jgi:hypothetical protein
MLTLLVPTMVKPFAEGAVTTATLAAGALPRRLPRMRAVAPTLRATLAELAVNVVAPPAPGVIVITLAPLVKVSVPVFWIDAAAPLPMISRLPPTSWSGRPLRRLFRLVPLSSSRSVAPGITETTPVFAASIGLRLPAPEKASVP